MPDQTHDATTVGADRAETCAICGGLIDGRETVSLWADDYAFTPDSDRTAVALLPDGEAHTDCFERVVDDPILAPEDALDTVMEFLQTDEHLRSHIGADDDLAAAIVAINFARNTSWPDQDWTTEWAQ